MWFEYRAAVRGAEAGHEAEKAAADGLRQEGPHGVHLLRRLVGGVHAGRGRVWGAALPRTQSDLRWSKFSDEKLMAMASRGQGRRRRRRGGLGVGLIRQGGGQRRRWRRGMRPWWGTGGVCRGGGGGVGKEETCVGDGIVGCFLGHVVRGGGGGTMWPMSYEGWGSSWEV